MQQVLDPFRFLFIVLAGWVGQLEQDIHDYVKEENRVLREQLGNKRLRLNDEQRRRLAVRAKKLGHQVLGEVASIVTSGGGLPIRFRKGVTVAGTVVDEAAHPLSGVLVWIWVKADAAVDPDIVRLSRSKSNRVKGGRIHAEADTQGHFEITSLPPGASFRLTATHRNGKCTPTRMQGFRADTAGQEMIVILKPR